MKNTPQLRTSRLVCTLVCFAAATALAGCNATLGSYLHAEGTSYESACSKRHDAYVGERDGKRYFPAKFFVHAWPGGFPQGQLMDESRLVDGLRSGEAKRLMILAGGGLGKTRLAESISAQTCGELPIFTVDLHRDTAERTLAKDGPNPILEHLAVAVGVADDAPERRHFEELLSTQRWLLVADSFEETTLDRRTGVRDALVQMVERYGKTMQIVVLVRPPVLRERYGLDAFDAVVQIPPLDCDRVDAVARNQLENDEDKRGFDAWVKHFGFDAEGRFGFSCIRPYLASYRDVAVLTTLYRDTQKEGVAPISHAAAYEHLVAARLKKELAHLNWTEREALDMVDRMVRVLGQSGGFEHMRFTLEGCAQAIEPQYGIAAVDAGVAGNAVERRSAVCEKVLQSAVFAKEGDAVGAAGAWTFSDPKLAGLFLARWLNAQLASDPSGDCEALANNAMMLKSAPVVRFLSGQAFGQRCMAPLLRELCKASGGEKALHIEAVIEGAPTGKMRFQVVQEARAWEANNGNTACTVGALDIIERTVGL